MRGAVIGHDPDMSEDQLQPQDSLDDRGVDDVLDEGFSPPEKPRGVTAKGVTDREQLEGETLDERLPQEEPEADPREDADLPDTRPLEMDATSEEDPPGDEVGDDRSGRLVAPDQGLGEDTEKDLVAEDVGIDGAGAPAEEAAMHTVEGEDEVRP